MDAAPFNWGKDYQRPNLAPEDIVVYEMGVRSFTADASSKLASGQEGTFAGLLAKVGVPYLSAVRLSDRYRMVAAYFPPTNWKRDTSQQRDGRFAWWDRANHCSDACYVSINLADEVMTWGESNLLS